MMTDWCALIPALLISLAWIVWTWRHQHLHSKPERVAATVQRLLKPRTPADCPTCRQQLNISPRQPHRPHPLRPWGEIKSRRGRPKRIATEGFACPRPSCAYYRITDAQVHALVGDGTHGKTERIQTFRCQACGITFSAQRHTALYRLKTASRQVGLVLTALAEGLSIAAASRVFGHSPETITRWVTRAGEHSASLHHRWLQRLHLPHLQLDELRTRLCDRTQVCWLWLVVDPLTKLIPVLHLGPRTQAAAHTVVHNLAQRLALAAAPSSRAMVSTCISMP